MSANTSSTKPPCKCAARPASVLRTVVKEGPNKGRQFYTCAKSSCKFFEWVNTNATNTLLLPSSSPSSQPSVSIETIKNNIFADALKKSVNNSSNKSSSGSTSSETDSNLNIPCCTNHQTTKCKLLQVSKEGPNKGKLFWACGNTNQSEKCNFFKWFDGIVDQYKHLVPNYNSGAQPSPKKETPKFIAPMIKEETVPIFMSTSNSQNNWVANLPVETFSEILKYLQIAPDCVKIQRVCVEWKRMSDIYIGNAVKDHQVDLSLGFLKNDTPFSQCCEIFKKFYRVKQVTFCNFTIYSELMRLLEWVQVETMIFYNCKSTMSCDQNESVAEHVPSYHDYEEVDWEYVRSNPGSLFSKRDIASYKTKFAFRRNVTQMLFSGLEEDRDVLVADAKPKFIDDMLQFATLNYYKKFVTFIKQKLGTNYVQGKRFGNLKRIISIDSYELNFAWVNKDRNVYYKVGNGICEADFTKFMLATQEKATIKEEDETTAVHIDWRYKNFMVQDRSIAIISIPFSSTLLCKVQIYNSISCSSKTVVERTPTLAPKSITGVLEKCNIVQYVKKDVFKPKNLFLAKYGLILGTLNLQSPYPRKTILEMYLESALASSRKMVSGDLDELKKFCYKDPIQKAIKLLLFLHRETKLMDSYEISSKVKYLIKSIDALWSHKEEFINDDDEYSDTPSINTITELVSVDGESLRVPFSWYHFIKTGNIKHIFELKPEEARNELPSGDYEEEDEEDEDDSEEENDNFFNFQNNNSDLSSEDGNEPEEDDDYQESNEEEEEEEEESDYSDDSDSGKKRKKKTRATRSKKRKY
ncbi:zf-GRF domain-containing protein [Naegleria gruberi]|uniref:Zf-GRF domain-containing protein n=1 Tax=Naegleria gruberi TaxID=5762 RepID=D2VUF2_NAEGR|nr:zf-GRF domain-containing protein [Naegleria gruberi]EFC39435.1 zf-GRF domain-containing protein [Naegleria gruberi]|eukprot:XP_002672179.1 zf-GRF domain-containing protein [Naegleria gruberi strain NEG-M]